MATIRQEQVNAFGDGACAKCAAASQRPGPSAQSPVGQSVKVVDPARKSWIAIKVIDADGDPVAGAPLHVTLPSGGSVSPRVDKQGKVRLEGISPGTCIVKLEDPRMVVVEQYKVQTGDSIDSLARSRDWTWQALSILNWGTDVPTRINEHLRDEVGCTRKTASGKNYVFTSEDVPGTMVLPKDTHELETEREHTLQLHKDPGPFITLESEVGIRIPEAEFEAHFSNGTTVRGRLDRKGRYRLIDPPKGKFSVGYPDPEDLLAKALAGMTRRGFDLPEGALDDEEADLAPTAYLFRMLMHDTPIVKAAFAKYDQYWNDRSGQGLRADIDQVVTEEEARVLCSGLLVHHGLKPLVPLALVPMQLELQPDEQLT